MNTTPRESPARRSGLWALVASAVIAVLALSFGAGPAEAIEKGTLTGTVTDAAGPVAGAPVWLFGANNNHARAITAADGSFSVEAWPDTYTVGAYPPSGSSDSFRSTSGVVVSEGATTSTSLVLSPGGMTHLTGTVNYPGNPPDAGMEVTASEERMGETSKPFHTRYTDEGGNWDYGEETPGFYRVSYLATHASGGGTLLASDIVVVEGPATHLVREVAGPLPGGILEGTVANAEGWSPAKISVKITGNGVSREAAPKEGKPFVIYGLPSGTYEVTAEPNSFGNEDDKPATVSVPVTEGRISQTAIQMSALPGLPGVQPTNEQQYLGWLNQQRSEWGLPAGLSSVPLWSQACASHDHYMWKNNKLEHPETAALPGHSEGGQWAGEHAVLSGGGGSAPTFNPWMDAPIHLMQVFAPQLLKVGIDSSNTYSCVTTWPGMLRTSPPGTIYTFPGNGTSGVPPVEFASELPSTPNEQLKLPPLTGRQLFIWQEGEDGLLEGTEIKSASLSSSKGPVEVKVWEYELGSDIIPVQPLEPFTRYTASVVLEPVRAFDHPGASPVSYSWSFTTGKNNPNGNWDETPGSGDGRVARLRVGYSHGHVVVTGKGWEPTSKIQVHRQVAHKRHKEHKKAALGPVVAKAKTDSSGDFTARFRWPQKRRVTVRVEQGSVSLQGTYIPKNHKHHKVKHRRRRSHHRDRRT